MLFKFIPEMIRSALELANKCGLVCVDVEGNSWTKSDTVRNCDADSGKPKNGRIFREDGSEHASPIRMVGCNMVLPFGHQTFLQDKLSGCKARKWRKRTRSPLTVARSKN